MSPPRLIFLYPWLSRSVGSRQYRLGRNIAKPSYVTGGNTGTFSTAACRKQELSHKRYGTAHKPLSLVTQANDTGTTSSNHSSSINEQRDDRDEQNRTRDATPIEALDAPKWDGDLSSKLTEHALENIIEEDLKMDQTPLETVLKMPAPSEEAEKPPHLTTPPYIHHFDTYSLVKDLETGGFSQEQAITIMKAVRGLLTHNMDLARDGLVSRSNVENETYLFRAACSELRTEIQNNRKLATEQMRTERTQLQHEADILNQKLAQESLHLKDELKGMFDDRKMAVRMEQRSMESKIQELNYKITVALNSDARSDVEGLRWILTRRSVAAIALCAIMFLATLRYTSYMTQAQDLERKKMNKEKNIERHSPSSVDIRRENFNPTNQTWGGSAEGTVGEELITTEGGVSLG